MNNLFFKNFVKKELRQKVSHIDNIWIKTSEKIQSSKQEIDKNIKRIGKSDITNLLTNRNIEDIYKEYQKYWNQYKTFKNIPRKQLREGFLILFPNSNKGIDKGLYDCPHQFDDFLTQCKNKQSYLRRLISELLYYYPKNKLLLFTQLNKIYNHLDKNKKSNHLFIQANRHFYLIEEKGPSIIAKNILDTSKDLDSILKDIWIKERHLSCGIGEQIAKEICIVVKDLTENKDILNRLLEYFSGKKAARYNQIQPIAKTLLDPFKNKAPEKSVKTKITKFLDQHIGDPRHKSERWINMPEQKAIFLRWKVDETIKDFLELLTYTAQENYDADRMWRYRKEFIECYWEADFIRDAWIVLGKKDYENKDKFLKEGLHEYGQLQKGNLSAHSVLLIRIGDLIISEWNYNGKIRIWKEGNKYAPQFYQKEYNRNDVIKGANKEFIHSNSEEYSWQKRVSDYIYNYTGILCPDKLQRKSYDY